MGEEREREASRNKLSFEMNLCCFPSVEKLISIEANSEKLLNLLFFLLSFGWQLLNFKPFFSSHTLSITFKIIVNCSENVIYVRSIRLFFRICADTVRRTAFFFL